MGEKSSEFMIVVPLTGAENFVAVKIEESCL